MKLRNVLTIYACLSCAATLAQSPIGESHTTVRDFTDSAGTAVPSDSPHNRKGNIFKQFFRAFNAMDTTYITPNKYNWAFMLQNTNSFETYTLHSRELGQKLSFSPRPAIKIGPYLGWRWIFLGYTFEVSSLGKGQQSKKTEFELSLYSSMLGCDLIYRRTGDDFRLRKVKGLGEEAREVEGENYHGINVKVTGINAYYIFNHKRFSYPAAFAQSTVQRKSCGSWKVGFAYTRHELDFDYNALPPVLTHNPNHELSQDFQVDKVKYTDFSLSCGYAYNWVFKKNWLFCISIVPAIGYKKTHTAAVQPENETETSALASHLRNLNFDVTGRAGLVWNNTKYFGGLSLIVHNYNYRHNRLSINNTFGTLNLYIGLNFHKRKAYR